MRARTNVVAFPSFERKMDQARALAAQDEAFAETLRYWFDQYQRPDLDPVEWLKTNPIPVTRAEAEKWERRQRESAASCFRQAAELYRQEAVRSKARFNDFMKPRSRRGGRRA